MTRSDTSRAPIPGLSFSSRLVSALAISSEDSRSLLDGRLKHLLCNGGYVLGDLVGESEASAELTNK